MTCSPLEACRIMLLGARNYILWCQGVIPEESCLRNKSKLRVTILSLIEKWALAKASFCLFVSDEMRLHYEKKYEMDFSGRYFIMPCFNTTLKPDAFRTKGKYSYPTFAYVGSLTAWQCFEETVDLYRAIELRVPHTRLKVLTFEQDKALAILKSKGVKNFEVGCVPPEKVPEELSNVSYGFVIREDNIVNRVATPTKLSSYMSAGVIPVYSECLRSFTDFARTLHFALPVDGLVSASYLAKRCAEPVNGEDVLNEYRRVFDSYYSREYYVERLAPLLDRVLAGGREVG